MFPANKTLDAINAKLELDQDDGFRNHLGASVIGKKCQRELWYLHRWAVKAKHSGGLLRLFNRGHLEEARFVGYLRAIGLKVWDFDPDAPPKNGQPQQFRVSAHDGHFGGSLDGIALGVPDLPNREPCSLSFKTHNDASFKKLQELGVTGSKFEHFVQEQVYMHHLPKHWGVKTCLYMADNKNNDELHLELLKYNVEIATNADKRAADIIYSNEPPARIAESPGYWACKFCSYNRLCHFADVQPAVNCRTCRFSRPSGAGLWHCGLQKIELDQDAQRKGCNSYQVKPSLVTP